MLEPPSSRIASMCYQPPRFLDPREPFGVGDRHDAGGHGPERADRRGYVGGGGVAGLAARPIGRALVSDGRGG
jgi:hypothetical protein